MNIDTCRVYDLEESIVASGLPMLAEYDVASFIVQVQTLTKELKEGTHHDNPDFKRACKLANNPAGSGHNNFLSGILVSANVTATNAWYLQMERYHFVQIVSSQSKMHRLRQMMDWHNEMGAESCFHEKVFENGITLLKDLACDKSGIVDDADLVYNCPMGLELTARITTNYLQLKTIYNQRKNHKLAEWHDYCDWIKTLPLAAELITNEK